MTQHESQVVKFSNKTEVFDNSILHLYAFKDKKIKEFTPPTFALNDDEFIRQASSIVNFSNSLICKFPQDYDIYYLGSFCKTTGNIISCEPELICSCSELKTEKSLQYDELLKQVESTNQTALSYLSEFQTAKDKHYRNESVYREEFENFLNDSKEEIRKAIELFPINQSKKELTKKSIIDKLFNH